VKNISSILQQFFRTRNTIIYFPFRQGACTNTGFLPDSDPAPIVEFFTRTGITAAGGQSEFERCTRKMIVHRNRKRNLLVLLYLRRKYKNAKDNTGLGTDLKKYI
jgi:hypothetical protein